MKFTKGENWWKINITKNKIIYYGPSQKGNVAFRIGSRRIKLALEYNKLTKEWLFHFGGSIRKNSPKTEHVDYIIRFIEIKDDQSL